MTTYAPGLTARLRYDPSDTGLTSLSTARDRYYESKLSDGSYPSDDPGWNLLRTIGRKNKGVSFNPYLTTKRTAEQYVSDLQAKDPSKYGGWGVRIEDLDYDQNTPDDVIIHDAGGNPIVVSGYRIKSGAARRKAAVLYNQYPSKRAAAIARGKLKQEGQQRLFNKYLYEQAQHASQIAPYDERWASSWIERNPSYAPGYYDTPTNMKPYARICKIVHKRLGEMTGPKTEPYREFYMEIARLIISDIWKRVKKDGGDSDKMQHDYIDTNWSNFSNDIEIMWKSHADTLSSTYGTVPTPYIYKKKAMNQEE
jgi:hypothetical protein